MRLLTVRSAAALLALVLSFPPRAIGSSLTDAKQLLAAGAGFTWEDAQSRSVKILVQRRDQNSAVRSSIGSGFLISPDGLFVTAYHVMKYCLGNKQSQAGFSVALDCSKEHANVEYRALNGGREFEVEIVSYLPRADSIKGDVQTPEETIELKDFVIARLKAPSGVNFPYWRLSDFKYPSSSNASAKAPLQLKPLLPPKRVFIAGYAAGPEFSLAEGFLNITEDQHRAYFAWNRDIYEDPHILQRFGIPTGTRWGIPVANYMSGGAVIETTGDVLGLVVNQGGGSAGILSMPNLLDTFFSRTANPDTKPAILLRPSDTPLYLRAQRDASY
jgi:trypsin-like peptidase